ncbi:MULTISPECIES: hypothetical protein [Pseudomonas]|uniref:Uncharacterized protein n=1 Tax=Pseudomonas protegens TaxID=380021 RepID=A0A2T6GBP8_9PSED|nr:MULTISPECIES: hypothetical protein [Pseudomonas]PUA41557.1 hypothetical protein C5U62_30965 [Pseudomonas protegens]RXU68347.1 hypothetical protein CW358_09800 [Pseudomonas protegens]ULT72753.1 hypothetical protein L1O02_10460 [Pseudomonas sp. BC42]BAQ75834.1 uncharacterized protein POS17_4140 [Pseudomonas sp. Os17]BAQ81991.1 uncharacterized protein PST29_4102 [Pseudomonas sp. St29]
MYFDHQHFPLVWMRRAEDAGQPGVDPFQQLEALMQRAQAFVLMSDVLPEPEQRNSQQNKALLKQGSLWMKRNKAAIRRWIKAMIVIAPQPEAQAGVEAFARNYEKFWGYPLLHSASPLAAISLAQQLLAPPRSNLNNW